MLTTPEELKTLEQKVEDARNLLTAIELDQIRLSRLAESERYTLSELNKAKSDVSSQIDILTVKKNTLDAGVAALVGQKTALQEELALTQAQLAKVKETIINETKEHEETKTALKNKEGELAEKEASIASQTSDILAREARLKEREIRLQGFINSL